MGIILPLLLLSSPPAGQYWHASLVTGGMYVGRNGWLPLLEAGADYAVPLGGETFISGGISAFPVPVDLVELPAPLVFLRGKIGKRGDSFSFYLGYSVSPLIPFSLGRLQLGTSIKTSHNVEVGMILGTWNILVFPVVLETGLLISMTF